MGPRMRVGIVALVGLLAAGAAAAGQFPALNVGTVTARIDGAPFSAVVSIASMADGDLVLSNISNQVTAIVVVPRPRGGWACRRLRRGG